MNKKIQNAIKKYKDACNLLASIVKDKLFDVFRDWYLACDEECENTHNQEHESDDLEEAASMYMSRAEEKAQAAYPAWRNGIGDEFNSNSAYYGFIEGYNQAEKDLMDISWIKEISGVKELSSAKEEALKAYPPQSIAANYDTTNRMDAFEYGYLKAEKDLELTWEDIDWIVGEAVFRVSEDSDKEQICKEVLKLFKDFKERKGEVI